MKIKITDIEKDTKTYLVSMDVSHKDYYTNLEIEFPPSLSNLINEQIKRSLRDVFKKDKDTLLDILEELK